MLSFHRSPLTLLVVLFLFSLLILIPLDTASAQITTTLSASKDNTLFEDLSGSLSNGAGASFFLGRTNSDDTIRRGILAFDIAGQIPSGSTITSVTLTLYLSRVKNGTYDHTLHKVTADWGEAGSNATLDGGGQGAPSQTGDATWIHSFYPTTFWATAGGDYVATASATTSVPNTLGPYTWSSSGMIADVQDWLDNPGTDFGWVVKSAGAEAVKRTARRFDTKENPTPSQRPQLEITYTTASVSGACCLPSDSCAVLTPTECSNQGGTYQGDNTSCSPDPCVEAVGACCFDDGSCSELTEADCLAQSGTYQGDATSCATASCPIVLEPYVDALPIPGTAVPVTGAAGDEALYEIAMTQFKQKLHRDLDSTTVWGYGGSYPGPTIEAFRDKPVLVRWMNDLRDSTGAYRIDHYLPVDTCMHGPDMEGNNPRTVVHLHGGHVMAKDDGYPEHTFLPGEGVTYWYPNNQDPATLWYHDHALGITRLNVMMGLAGFYLLRDAAENALNLPPAPYEIGLAIQDRMFKGNGDFDYPVDWQGTWWGDKILVNGKVWPYLDVVRGKYRFRMLNGSTTRAYRLFLSTGDPFTVIGTEGGLLPAPVVRDTVIITPGERLDVVIDFALYGPGTEIILANDAPVPFPGTPGENVIPNIMKFIVQGGPTGFTDPLPTTLLPVPEIPESTSVVSRDFHLEKGTDACAGSIWEINGLHWNDITEFPLLGTTEIWRFINRTGMVHPMHMHLVMFQVLDRQAFTIVADTVQAVGPPIPPDSSQAGWKDTVPVYPGEMVRVIAKFEDYLGKYAYHCHILEHEDHEMMRQFEVVTTTAVPETPLPLGLFLAQNHPNPFGPATRISFGLPERSHVSLRIFDIAGREVRTLIDAELPARTHDISWDGRDNAGRSVQAGVFLVRLEANDWTRVKKMALVR